MDASYFPLVQRAVIARLVRVLVVGPDPDVIAGGTRVDSSSPRRVHLLAVFAARFDPPPAAVRVPEHHVGVAADELLLVTDVVVPARGLRDVVVDAQLVV